MECRGLLNSERLDTSDNITECCGNSADSHQNLSLIQYVALYRRYYQYFVAKPDPRNTFERRSVLRVVRLRVYGLRSGHFCSVTTVHNCRTDRREQSIRPFGHFRDDDTVCRVNPLQHTFLGHNRHISWSCLPLQCSPSSHSIHWFCLYRKLL